MIDWSEKVRQDQPNAKIVTMWFVLSWDEFISLKRGLEVYVNGKEYVVFGYGDYYPNVGCVRIDLKEQ